MLSVIDEKWRDHLYEMDMLKEGIGLRAWGQKDPLIEYKREAFAAFETMMESLGEDVVKRFFRVSIVREPQRAAPEPPPLSSLTPRVAATAAARESHASFSAFGGGGGEGGPPQTATSAPSAPAEPVRVGPKVGRNDPCPCGSGKKYKKCHGVGA